VGGEGGRENKGKGQPNGAEKIGVVVERNKKKQRGGKR